MISRIVHKVQRTWRKALYLGRMEGLLYSRKKQGDIIVMYHNVDQEGNTNYNLRFHSRADFLIHARYFQREFTVVSLREMLEVPNPGVRRLAITFDDGLANNLKHAAVILRHFSLPATFFVTAAGMNNQSYLWPDAVNILTHHWNKPVTFNDVRFIPGPWNRYRSDHGEWLMNALKHAPSDQRNVFIDRLESRVGKSVSELAHEDHYRILSQEEIRLLAAYPLFEIGSHAVSHSNLATLNADSQFAELHDSKKWIEEVIGKSVESIAFPDGSYTRETVSIAEQVGYRHQCAVNYLYHEDETDNRIINRLGLYNDRSAIEQLHQLNQRFHAK
ncbi:MAG: polysaccharide deacetylase family protein [Flavobacteriales bacterium]|nr:polysaccharide deacetylase family protein [Flavobacteriales bacterium]